MKKFTNDHEWVLEEGAAVKVGITDYAQSQLGDVVFVELPELGRVVKQGEPVAVVESTKAASDIYAPLSGEIVSVNTALPNMPQEVNMSPEDKAWFFTLRPTVPSELESLMDETAYQKLVG